MAIVKVMFFANLKDLAGVRQIDIQISENMTIEDLRKLISTKFPGTAKAIQSSILAVNHEYSHNAFELKDGDEIAVFPPVSGGTANKSNNDIFLVTEDQLDVNDLLARLTASSTGAICLFTGVVRGLTTRGTSMETSYLEYEAYVPMAEDKMRQVADEIRKNWPSVESIAIIQRIGKLYPGTPTILIACSAAHRDTGVFEAARYGIDRLKEIVPIWKKEVGPQGQSWVEGDYYPGPGE